MAMARFVATAGDPSGEFDGFSNFTITLNSQDASSQVRGTYYSQGMANRIDVVDEYVAAPANLALPSASTQYLSWQIFTNPANSLYGQVVCYSGTSPVSVQSGAYEIFKLTITATTSSLASNEPPATSEF